MFELEYNQVKTLQIEIDDNEQYVFVVKSNYTGQLFDVISGLTAKLSFICIKLSNIISFI